MKELFQGAIKFQEEDFAEHKELYESLKKSQNPHTLFVSCSDSRVVPNMITSTNPGDLFVVRNIGNIIPPYTEPNLHEQITLEEGDDDFHDLIDGERENKKQKGQKTRDGRENGRANANEKNKSTMRKGYLATTSAIEYAINILEVQNIIVCGHSNCGACAAIFDPPQKLANAPYVKKWIELLNPVKDAVLALKPESKSKRMWLAEQINVELQLQNLMTYPFVEEKFDRGELNIYGWYYIIETGEILNYNMIKRQFKPITPDTKF